MKHFRREESELAELEDVLISIRNLLQLEMESRRWYHLPLATKRLRYQINGVDQLIYFLQEREVECFVEYVGAYSINEGGIAQCFERIGRDLVLRRKNAARRDACVSGFRRVWSEVYHMRVSGMR